MAVRWDVLLIGQWQVSGCNSGLYLFSWGGGRQHPAYQLWVM